MVDVAALQEMQQNALAVAKDYGVTVKALTPAELKKFGLSFDRQFIRQYPERQIQDILERHKAEILIGAMAAKEQMDANIDGEFPGSGKIGGPLAIRAAWIMKIDDWESIYEITNGTAYFTPGSPVNWIHSGTTKLGGTAGNAVKIKANAVHVVVALGSYHPSPKIESFKFEIDGKEKPILLPKWAQLSPKGMKIKELDRGFIWKKDTTVKAQVFISQYMPAAITQAVDYPYLFGASFIKEDELRVHDPTNISTDVVTTT